jgi:hypothetical protein
MDAQAGLDPCWSQTHYVGFVVTRLKCIPNGSRNVSLSEFVLRLNLLGIMVSNIFFIAWNKNCHNIQHCIQFVNLRVQSFPVPEYPMSHEHVKEPIVLVHFWLQLSVFAVHSSMSVNTNYRTSICIKRLWFIWKYRKKVFIMLEVYRMNLIQKC